jgi:hypothetical protein
MWQPTYGWKREGMDWGKTLPFPVWVTKWKGERTQEEQALSEDHELNLGCTGFPAPVGHLPNVQ